MCNVRSRAAAAALVISLLVLSGVAGVACELPGAAHMPVEDGDCAACHLDDYEGALDPVHVGNFPLTCERCHGEDTWVPAKDFDHARYFELRFKHAEAACGSCHSQGFEAGDTPTECAGCHRDDYDAATRPPHEGYPLACENCHSEEAFRPSTFAHSWPLQNSHAQTPCSSCHVGDPPRYEGTPTQCVDCHRADYDAALEPPHDGFSTDCAGCHDDTGWREGSGGFVHAWPLEGVHATAPCFGCHVGNPPRYAGTSTECVDCHADERAGAEPPHDGFSDDCASCHTTTGFRPARFDHAWPLTGAHDQAQCASCHVGTPARYAGTPTECVGCHKSDYDASPFPGHDAFPLDCAQCHTTSAWTGAGGFDHPWPLTGAHGQAQCESCHVGNPPRYAGTPSDCVGCHKSDYDASPFPGHDAFPLDCAQCHTTNAWTPASGGHPNNLFPLSGAHNMPCNDCHNPALGQNGRDNADCVGCHTGAHSRARMDNKHNEVRNYPSGTAPPNFCLDCHRTGRGN